MEGRGETSETARETVEIWRRSVTFAAHMEKRDFAIMGYHV